MKQPQEYLANWIVVDTQAVDPAAHTMQSDALARYVATKFSPEQYAAIDEALAQKRRISVHGFYDGWIKHFCKHYSLTMNARFVRDRQKRYGRTKEYNSIRPSVLDVTGADGTREVVILVFPSHEYVLQFAEIVATHAALIGSPRPIPRYHYPDHELELADWSGFAEGLSALDDVPAVVIVGEIALLRAAFLKLDFGSESPRRDFGLKKMFTIQRLDDIKHRRCIYLLGCKQSYWGSAAGILAGALAAAGVHHVIYAAKAGNLISEDHIHRFFCPSQYWLLSQDPRDPGEPRMTQHEVHSPIRDVRGFLGATVRTGIHLTVPSVVGETQAQRSAHYEAGRPATIDNEISFIAREIQNFNARNDKRVEFTALHFITDYLYDEQERPAEATSDLSVLDQKYYEKKKSAFYEIACIIDTYAALSTTTETNDDGDPWSYSVFQILEKWAYCKELLRKVDPADVSPHNLMEFMLRARFGAYYNGDAIWAFETTKRICDGARGRVHSFELVERAVGAVHEYHAIRTTIHANQQVENRDFSALAKRCEQAAETCGGYASYVMKATQVQVLVQTARHSKNWKAVLGAARVRLADAQQTLARLCLRKTDELFERAHLGRLRAFVEELDKNRRKAQLAHLEVLATWELLFEECPREVQWIVRGEIALTKLDLMLLDYKPKDQRWYLDVHNAPHELFKRFGFVARLHDKIGESSLLSEEKDAITQTISR
jgi:hypothetical protein